MQKFSDASLREERSKNGQPASAHMHSGLQQEQLSKQRRAKHQHGQSKKRYIPALDGLRALAVVAVVLYHLDIGWARGGLLGVTVFFVLSGFLITGILLNEIHEHSAIDLKRFWIRRVRRLFPAIVLVIVVAALLCVIFNHPLLTKMRPDIVPSLFWFQNWWYVLRNVSYFADLGDPSPLTHFWSLAIEEQFYLIWPLLLIALCTVFRGRRKPIRRACLVLSLISVVLMAVLYDPMGDPTRVYYGTDTRAFSLLIGAYIAMLDAKRRQWGALSVCSGDKRLRVLDIVGGVALTLLLVMMVFVSGTSAFMYRGGLLIASLLSAAVLLALADDRTRLGRAFAAKPLVWIGKRSYGIYLWHFPILLLLRAYDASADGSSWWLIVLVFVLSFTAAALSYRFVEEPFRHGALGKALSGIRAQGFAPYLKSALGPASIAAALACTCVVVGTGIGCAVVPDDYVVPQDAITSTGQAADQAMDLDEPVQKSAKGKKAQKAAVKKREPLLIGDSVPGDSNNEFKSKFPHGLNDSYVGRNLEQGIKVFKQYVKKRVVGDVVVFACFSNVPIVSGQLDDLYEALPANRQLFLVNMKAPEKFESKNNELLEEFAGKHDNVHVIDWYSTVKEHMSDYLWKDREHLKPTGARAYQDLIYENIKPYLSSKDYKTSPAVSSKLGQ